jgi:hypothetical protein
MIYATEASTKATPEEVVKLFQHVVDVGDDCFLEEAQWLEHARKLAGMRGIIHRHIEKDKSCTTVRGYHYFMHLYRTPKLLPMLFTPPCHARRHIFASSIQAL